MLGLAYMALKLAERRQGSCVFYWNQGDGPVSRDTADARPANYPGTREYFRICDRIARGEKP